MSEVHLIGPVNSYIQQGKLVTLRGTLPLFLKKSKHRLTAGQKSKETAFSEKLDALFDIAHADAQNRTECLEDLSFLALQRNGRIGYMTGEDKVWTEKKRAKINREEAKERSKQKAYSESQENMFVSFSSESDSCNELSDNDTDQPLKENSNKEAKKRKISFKSLVTKELTSALDRTKVSDRHAVHVIAATASAHGHSINDITLSRSSVC